jgi:hypothetical protein
MLALTLDTARATGPRPAYFTPVSSQRELPAANRTYLSSQRSFASSASDTPHTAAPPNRQYVAPVASQRSLNAYVELSTAPAPITRPYIQMPASIAHGNSNALLGSQALNPYGGSSELLASNASFGTPLNNALPPPPLPRRPTH